MKCSKSLSNMVRLGLCYYSMGLYKPVPLGHYIIRVEELGQPKGFSVPYLTQ